MPTVHRLGMAFTVLLPLVALASPKTEHYVDARTGLDAWQVQEAGVRIQLIQRLPDQTRAFFQGRGFAPAAAERIARRCVLQTVVTNSADNPGPIRVDLHDWGFRQAAGFHPLLLKDRWQQRWQQLGVPRAARIAFQWALFPTTQVFAPGDWNMGMTTYPVEPGTRMEVRVQWTGEGRPHQALIGPVRCAPDTRMEEK